MSINYKIYCIIATIGFIFYLYKFYVRYDKNSFYWNTILFISTLFPLAKVCQVLIIGPRFIRHHITDFGYIPFFAMTIYASPFFQKRILFSRCLFLSFWFAFIIELLQINLIKRDIINEAINSKTMIAAGDFIDIFMYLMSYYVCKTLYDIYVFKLKVFN